MLNRSALACCMSIALFSAGFSHGGESFSQYPGFAEYFAAHPPGRTVPGRADQALLQRFRPRFMLPPGHSGLIDFYGDYIANGTLRDERGTVVSRRVTRNLLNDYRNNPGAIFVHEAREKKPPAVVFGRIERDSVVFDTSKGTVAEPLTFLTYHAVFRTSGLPAGISGWQEALLGLVGDLDDWHQLDHYTAVTVVLEGDGHQDFPPRAVIMQQHNNLRAYLVGEGITIPSDGRVVVDAAIRSNELYPHTLGRTRHRAVSMPTPKAMRYLLTGEGKPLTAGDDITHGVQEAKYRLTFLRPDDAFYTFKGFLGERRRLPGRDGPPGADYNTLPELKPLGMQLGIGYWREDHPGDLSRFEETIGRSGDYAGFARLQGRELYRNGKR